ncbi:hypothetical protein EJP82_25130 [Paenibacillus anaericanus]|uniref:Tyr recombinase domain-containing protein n=1 Tax=Paenibacillus anaericanus TaxID=170367 RepID=A0A3S1DA51_9BACL|nr:tyrosine-type recombinase/integrase [Paenibacillus anaericanus]RUT40370.1 hypothetical protein EJP82_25130 [Paenibacillus anaericanus]
MIELAKALPGSTYSRRKLSFSLVIDHINRLETNQKHKDDLILQLTNSLFIPIPPQKKLNCLKTRTVERLSPDKKYCKAILEFSNFYRTKYTESTIDVKQRSLRKFINFLSTQTNIYFTSFELSEFSDLSNQNLLTYERFLVREMESHSIQKCTVYKYLRTMQLFIDLLRAKNISKLRYIIPPELRDNGKCSNIKASVEEIAAILEALDNLSVFKERDLTVVLLTMELGCRPIELVNITLNDLELVESKIVFFCQKSGQRTLNISKHLTKLLKKYLLVRATFNLNHDYLFTNQYGEPLSRSGVASIMGRANLRAFGERRINPKALRHTYATNALDNLNDFDEVSKALGHLHWSSTEYYVHKSISRLLNMSLPYNPANQIKKEV